MYATRRVMLGGLAATGLVGGAIGSAPAQRAGDPPPFGSASRQFTLIRPARPLPAIQLVGLDGKSTELTSLHGKVVLLNFWATWCAACHAELPDLDRVQEALGGRGLQVLAVSVDRQPRTKVKAYLQRLRLQRIAVYADPDARVAFSNRDNPHQAPFALYGMPITYLVDRSSRVRGYMPGEGDWSSSQGLRLLHHYLDSA